MKITNSEIKELVMELGSLLSDNKHNWSNELRKKFERITSYLSLH
jgi:two-component SAPR family response regulator